MKEPAVLHGYRRDLTREVFEDLAALQCEIPEILGYVGTTQPKRERWCKSTYRRPLPEILHAVRQDGLIAIRRASFDQLKKSATIISQQYSRFLPDAGKDPRENAEAAIQALNAAMAPEEGELRELFGEGGEG